ncbi:MAG TPA: hypothetical protein ACHBZ9_02290 [Arsenophonus nasoniae]|uniref:hypothetical protein n=1 Tax=Arsenophonus nasoniae TaxID=638 RepID=UPI00387918CC
MKSELIKCFLSSGVPCGFVDNEGKVDTNVKMTDLLYLLIHLPEMGTLLEKIQSEKSPFSLTCNLPSNFNKSPTVWQFHFLPLFAHLFCEFRVTVLTVISGYLPLPRQFARVARSLGCGER